MRWMIHQEGARNALASYERAVSFLSSTTEQVASELGITAEVVAEARAAHGDAPLPDTAAGVAIIPIQGILLDEPDAFFDMFGVNYSDYQTIQTQLAFAEADPSVETIVLDVDSPGGLVSGMFDAAKAIAAVAKNKPVTAVVNGMSASAAYVLTSQASRVVATGKADSFGSIGVVADLFVSDSIVSIASTDAPDKRPDVTTDEGQAVVRAELDEVHDLLADVVGEGRGVTRAQIDSNFGRGGVMLADRALAAGMIDEIQSPKEPEAMANQQDQATGVRAVFGLGKDAGHEEIIAACIDYKARADKSDAISAELVQALALVEASKEQLAKAQANAEALEAKDKTRETQDFEARRTGVIEAALKDGKIVPAQKDKLLAIATDEKGLKSLEELFNVTASNGLTKVSPAAKEKPKGEITASAIKDYAKTYRCSENVAATALAAREG